MAEGRDEWSQRIKAVERQFKAARLAIEKFWDQVQADASIVHRHPDAGAIKDAWRDLEPTYAVRVFAVFENGLRSYWHSVNPGKKPDARPLMEAIGSRRRIPFDVLNQAHEIREFRNQIVHQKRAGAPVLRFSMEETRRRLALFVDRLPFRW